MRAIPERLRDVEVLYKSTLPLPLLRDRAAALQPKEAVRVVTQYASDPTAS